MKRESKPYTITKKGMRGMLCCVIINMLFIGIACAQTVTGKVSDVETGEDLPGVSVQVKGLLTGTITDANGNYTLQLEGTASETVIVFSFLGYFTQEKPIGNQTILNVSLKRDVVGLDEVVVVGYGTQKKSDLTGSVSQVKAEELEALPVYNIEEALKSRAAGVRVTKNSGSPTSGIQVRIRGGNSMIGSNEPLYVVDGFPLTGGIDYLNPSDVASVNILKDASATAIYGSRGANGVVMITTKRGQRNQDGKIEISSQYTVQHEIGRYEMLDAEQYAIVANEWLKNEGLEPYFDLNEIQGSGTNWQDLIFSSAPIQNHTITFSGGGEKTRYSFSGNYFDQEGIIMNTGAKRGSLRMNLDHDVNKWIKLGTSLVLVRKERRTVPVDNGSFGFTIYSDALSAPPTLPVYDDEGLYTRIEQIYSFGSLDMRNPLLYSEPRKSRALVNTIRANTNIELSLLEGLTFKSILGLEYHNVINENFTPLIFDEDQGYASDGYGYESVFLSENLLNYSAVIREDHTLDIIGGFNYQTYVGRGLTASVTGLSNNIIENYDLSSAEIVNPPSNSISEWKLLSLLGRVNYSFNSKYLATVSIRSDGSSRFGANNKWGYFPSGAIAWRVSEESFMDNVSFVSDLKLRASYGITGNTGLSPYQSLSRLRAIRVVLGNRTEVPGYVPDALPNTALKWESTAQIDIGLDLSILEGRVGFVFDYYKKNTKDLLASVPLPPSVGFGSVLQNIGEIENEGVEFTIDANIVSNNKLVWDINAQLSRNKNKVVKLAGSSDVFGPASGHPFNTTTNIARVGKPYGMFYGFVEMDELNEEGLTQYTDTDGNGIVNSLDRVILGSPYPDFIYGFNNNISYKNFDLNIFLEGVYGNLVFWETSATHLNSFQRGQNQFTDLAGNYWTEEDPDPYAKFPKISSVSNETFSNRYLKKGNYLRIKTIKLAYNIPVRNSVFDKAQVYVSGVNLATFTDYPGLNPDVSTKGSGLQMGIDKSAYPTTRNFIVGIKLGF